MKFLELKIPPLVLLPMFALIMWSIDQVLPVSIFSYQVALSCFIVLVALGVVFVLLGGLAFKKAQTTVNPMAPDESSALVTSGIYRITRNPMYVGFALMLLGFNAFIANLYCLPLVGLFITYLTRFQIKPEEHMLSKLFGQPYIEYCQQVRRWL